MRRRRLLLDAFFASASIEADRYARLRAEQSARSVQVTATIGHHGEGDRSGDGPVIARAVELYGPAPDRLPSLSRIRSDLRIGYDRAKRVRAHLQQAARAGR